MFNYWSIAISLLLIELTRRIFLTIQSGLTGPLSKIPGPVLGKFTWIPWVIEVVRGKHMESTKYLLEKYGDVVRVGKNYILQTTVRSRSSQADKIISTEYSDHRQQRRGP